MRRVGVIASDLNQTVETIKEIEKWSPVRFNRTLDGRFENSAEHSWQGAVAAMVLQDYYPEKLNMERWFYVTDPWFRWDLCRNAQVFDDEKSFMLMIES